MSPATPLLRVADIRTVEHRELTRLPVGTLMQRAGAAATAIALELLAAIRPDAMVVVLVGPGNNGGDALEVATALLQAGRKVTVWQIAELDPAARDAVSALARARQAGVMFAATAPAPTWGLVIDGLFGIGLTRPLVDHFAEAVALVNQFDGPVLALDVPSGLDADTGAKVGGAHAAAIRATHTVTFIADKPGLHTAAGADLAGTVTVAALGLVAAADPLLSLNHAALFASAAQPRPRDSNKGSFGEVSVIGGADGMIGAVLLAARAALFGGAGRIYAGFIGTPLSHDPNHPELMCRHAEQLELGRSVLVVGPGLGRTDASRAALMRALQASSPIVLDADALNLLAELPQVRAQLLAHNAPVIITPHPLEAARLLGCTVEQVQADRLQAASTLAHRYGVIAILKGAGSVIADPQGHLVINPTGNPALATGGTGDVLAGFCGALLAQGWPAWSAALGAVWMHGQAADSLVAAGIGPVGMTASELLPQLRYEHNRLIAQRLLIMGRSDTAPVRLDDPPQS